ncbi:hoka [Cochliomyia hominivorax]
MKLMKNTSTYLVIFLIVFACCTQETEALRRVLRGRKTFTRSYFAGLAIPGWALVLLLALSELLLGAVLYLVMYKFILTKDVEPTTNTYAPAPTTTSHEV